MDAAWEYLGTLPGWLGAGLLALGIFGKLYWPKLMDWAREKPQEKAAPKRPREAHATIITEIRSLNASVSSMSAKIDDTRADVSELRGDVKDVRDRVSRLEATTDHMGKLIDETRTDTRQIMVDTQQSRDLFARIRGDIAEAQRARGEKTWQTAAGDD